MNISELKVLPERKLCPFKEIYFISKVFLVLLNFVDTLSPIEISASEKKKQLVKFDYENVNSISSRPRQ